MYNKYNIYYIYYKLIYHKMNVWLKIMQKNSNIALNYIKLKVWLIHFIWPTMGKK